MSREKVLKGIVLSKGISIGQPLFLGGDCPPLKNKAILNENSIEKEIENFRLALDKSKRDIQVLRSSFDSKDSIVADILSSHLQMLSDPEVTVFVEEKIRVQKKVAEHVLDEFLKQFSSRFESVKDNFAKERVKDVADVFQRILRHMRSVNRININQHPASIVFANEIAPSYAAEALPDYVFAFVSSCGGYSSHAAIIARSKRIPYVSNVDIKFLKKEKFSKIIVDGINGRVIVNPEEETLKRYQELKDSEDGYYSNLEREAYLSMRTVDDFKVRVSANIEGVEDIEQLLKHQAFGVGLFRSEYLILTRGNEPSEEEQFLVYSQIAKKLSNLPFIIRVFDLGGEKGGCFLENEEPASRWGMRGIRFLLKNPLILKTQLRAIVRASVFGNIHILIPFLSDFTELMAVKRMLKEVERELKPENVKTKKIGVGCMLELPAAALISSLLAKECDFLSIGTNDLIQYSLAQDRKDPETNSPNSPLHPSILKLLQLIVHSTAPSQKPLLLCGEIAADPRYTKLLLGLGIKEFSVSVRHIPVIKHVIRQTNIDEARRFAEKALVMSSKEALYDLIERDYREMESQYNYSSYTQTFS